MNRNEARELMMQLLFQMEAQNEFNKDIKNKFFEDKGELKAQKEYVEEVTEVMLTNRTDIDKMIEAASENWKIPRMNRVDLAIARLAIAEMCYVQGVPVSVSINEAVNLAKKFGTEDSGKFINGILGKIARQKIE